VKKKAFRGRSKGAATIVSKDHAANKLFFPYKTPNLALEDLPTEVDWRTSGVVTEVKDQGSCGSCWAFASTAMVESHIALATGSLFVLSTQQMTMCAPNPKKCGGTGGCNGSTAELGFEYVSGSDGMFLENDYPYNPSDSECSLPSSGAPSGKVNGFVKLPGNDYLSLMNAVAMVGPIAVNVDASSWSSYSSGIFNGCNQSNPDINHVVVVVGYGEEDGNKYWLVRNSWNTGYGEDGYIRVARSDDDEENCGMDKTPQHGVACEGEDEPVKVCGTCGLIYDSSYPTNGSITK